MQFGTVTSGCSVSVLEPVHITQVQHAAQQVYKLCCATSKLECKETLIHLVKTPNDSSSCPYPNWTYCDKTLCVISVKYETLKNVTKVM